MKLLSKKFNKFIFNNILIAMNLNDYWICVCDLSIFFFLIKKNLPRKTINKKQLTRKIKRR